MTEKKLLEHNQEGLIPGPDESEQAFFERVTYCLDLKKHIPDMLAHELPFAKEEMQLSEEILKPSCRQTSQLFDINPFWVPLFFSNYKLSFWQGGCAWIFQQKENSPTSAFFQLRNNFLKSNKYLGLYDRQELITHELAHVGRMKFEEPKFEEYHAYRSSKSTFRRYFGPIVQSSFESLIFMFVLLALVAVDFFSLTGASDHLIHLSFFLRSIVLGLIIFALIRLGLRHRQFNSCLKNLKKTLFNTKHAEAVLYRLTDQEIIDFSDMKIEEILTYANTQASQNLRWKVIFEAYFKNIEPSNHFDGITFHNIPPIKRSLKEVIKWFLTRKSKKWPKKIPDYPQAIPPKSMENGPFLVTFVNHSTLLLQWEGINILIDPIWSERCSPFKHFGPKRVHAPGIRFEELPPIDYVFLSHNHYDHMDLPTLQNLQKKYHPEFISGLGNQRYLENKDISPVLELDWWQEIPLKNGLSLIFTPAQHFSARNLKDANQTLWGGCIVKKGKEIIYFAGDTAFTHFFEEIKNRYGSPRLSFLPIGAYEPHWFMKSAHMSPKEAVQAHLNLESKKSIAIHFGTFPISDEGIDDPCRELIEALKSKKITKDTFLILNPGESYKG